MEKKRVIDVSVTAGDLAARARMDRLRSRVLGVACLFTGLFALVAAKLTLATVVMPMAVPARDIAPLVPEVAPPPLSSGSSLSADMMPLTKRATITDRNGQILAISLPLANVYADPRAVIDAHEAAHKIASILPGVKEDELVTRLSDQQRRFVYLAREITPDQEMAINDLGIPGVEFEAGEKRRYPLGRTAAQVMGAVDIDDHGVGGVEKFFDGRLRSSVDPLRLSLDVRVQAVVRDEVERAKEEFQAIGACGIVMDVRTGEVIAMVSLPDYDANDFGRADPDARFNRAVTGDYEPGSTFKLQTAAVALQDGVAHVWDKFSTVPIHVGRFTISDMKTDHFAPWLTLASVMAFSSNPGAAHIALDVGAQRQQAWLRGMGFFDRPPIELPEVARPIVPSPRQWGMSTVMTVGFGHGVAEPPISIVRGTAAAANGGMLVKPTLIARAEGADEPDAPTNGTQLMTPEVSEQLRKILRLVVSKGTGKPAEVPGYFVGGKTGTAEKVGAHGAYLKHVNVAAFTSIFPMNAPRYAVYVMIDSPIADKTTHGFTTAAWISAPAVAKIIARTAPMMGLFPVTDPAQVAAINAQIDMPLDPHAPSGARTLGPGNDPGDPGEGRIMRDNKPKDMRPRPNLVAQAAGPAATLPVGSATFARTGSATFARTGSASFARTGSALGLAHGMPHMPAPRPPVHEAAYLRPIADAAR